MVRITSSIFIITIGWSSLKIMADTAMIKPRHKGMIIKIPLTSLKDIHRQVINTSRPI